jgi:hypothetical protein
MSSEEFQNITHKKIGPKGVNGKPFINMEPFLQTDNFLNLHHEILVGLSKVEKFDHPFIMGEIPPELKKLYNNMPLESEILADLKKHDPTGFHQKQMQGLTKQQARRYMYLAFGAISPWYGVCYLKYNFFLNKTVQSPEDWTKDIVYFPELKKFILSLQNSIFHDIGRVLFFISYPNVATVVHRDYEQVPHKDHSVNFYFNEGRPAFIYNEVDQSKNYLDSNCRAYFFNNRDYHGVDAEPRMRYTLRVDGTFTSQIQKNLNLKDGYVY